MLLLRPSSIHGVGVFSTSAIPQGTLIELFAKGDWRFLRDPQGEDKTLCERYGIQEDDGYHCAKEWNRMSIGWYLNHAEDPSVEHENYVFYAARDIRPGEELTIDYATL